MVLKKIFRLNWNKTEETYTRYLHRILKMKVSRINFIHNFEAGLKYDLTKFSLFINSLRKSSRLEIKKISEHSFPKQLPKCLLIFEVWWIQLFPELYNNEKLSPPRKHRRLSNEKTAKKTNPVIESVWTLLAKTNILLGLRS